MDTLAATLDEELHALAHGDEHLLSESIEAGVGFAVSGLKV